MKSHNSRYFLGGTGGGWVGARVRALLQVTGYSVHSHRITKAYTCTSVEFEPHSLMNGLSE